MSYTNVYPSRINWENEPSIVSPINATNLNKMDYALYEHDQTLETWDTTKANQSDLLLSVKSIDYNTSTGVFVFTWQNGTTKTVDLNIEKIPVSFSMDANGVITMTTDDGTTYTADVGALIKTYTFTDSSEIDFTVTTDASGNKTITAGIVDGSITGSKLEPNYLANCQSAANSASASKTAAEGSAEDSEAWAVGQRDGVDVPSTDPAYHNNAKWYAEHGTGNSLVGLTDTDITSPTDGQVLTYNSTTQKWENDDPQAGGGSKITITTSDSGLYNRPVTLSDGTTTLTGTFSNSGEVTFEGVTLTGTLTISSSTSGGTTVSMTKQIPYFGNYEFELTSFAATITVAYPSGASCTLTGQGESQSATTNPQTFTVSSAGTYTITVVDNGVTSTDTVTISTSGESKSAEVGYISVTVTLYGAVEDTIAFTDVTGSFTEVFATGQSSKSGVSIKVRAGSPSVTFTSAVAKNPDNLSEPFSKSVTITSATTEIEIFPVAKSKMLYWYGYQNGIEDISTTNGWTPSQNYSIVAPSYAKNYISIGGNSMKQCGVSSTSTITGVANFIMQGVTTASSSYGEGAVLSSKNLGTAAVKSANLTSTQMTKISLESATGYISSKMANNRTFNLYAMWYE